MNSHFFTAPFWLLSFGSGFKVQGSRGGFAAKKGSQPRFAALSSPFQGKGLAWMFPPSFGRRCPEGAEVGGGKAVSPTHSLPL